MTATWSARLDVIAQCSRSGIIAGPAGEVPTPRRMLVACLAVQPANKALQIETLRQDAEQHLAVPG